MIVIDEHNFFAIVKNNTKVHQPSWGLCIQFGIGQVTLLLCFEVSKITNVKVRLICLA